MFKLLNGQIMIRFQSQRIDFGQKIWRILLLFSAEKVLCIDNITSDKGTLSTHFSKAAHSLIPKWIEMRCRVKTQARVSLCLVTKRFSQEEKC